MPTTDDAGDFAGALSRAVADRGATLTWLSQELHTAGLSVSSATLSYWQTGRSLPTRANSLRAVDELERLLRRAPGALRRLLPGGATERFDPIAVLARQEGVTEALLELDLMPTAERGYTNKFVEQAATVSADGGTQRETVRQLIQVEADELAALPLIFQLDQPAPTLPRVVALAGCSVAGSISLREGTVVVRLELDTPLERGELAMVEYHIDWDTPAGGEHAMARAIPDDVDYMVQSVRFAGRVPDTMARNEVPHDLSWGDDVPAHVKEPLSPAPFVEQVLCSPTAGAVGLSWGFR